VRLDANFATRFVNKSYRTCDVDRKRFATSHVRQLFATFREQAPSSAATVYIVHIVHSTVGLLAVIIIAAVVVAAAASDIDENISGTLDKHVRDR